MNIDELKLFLQLAKNLSFTKTAQESFVSPSTLSRCIQRMEEELGCPLFDRNNKSVALTKEGSRFVDYAQESLSKWSEIKTDLAFSSQKMTGTLRLFCSATAAYSILPSLLKSFRATYPQVEIDLEVGSRYLAHEKCKTKDLVVASFKESEEIEKIPLTKTDIVFVRSENLADPLLKKGGKFNLILTKKGVAGEAALGWLETHNFKDVAVQEVVGNEAVLALTAMGSGIGVVPKLVFDKSPLQEQLKIIPTSGSVGEMTVYLARTDKNPSPPAQALWKMTESRSLISG